MFIDLKKLIAGIAIGIANVIPGVSGGTIAVVFGVYEDMIDLASVNLKQIKSKWQSFLFLVLGIAMGIVGFAKIFKILYAKFPAQTNFFFIGLILGSIFIIFDMLKENKDNSNTPRLNALNKSLAFIVGLAIMVLLFFTKVSENAGPNIITTLSLTNVLLLFFAGVAGAIAMLIPGISGSFILLIMGVYHTVIQAISNFNLVFLFIIGLGVLSGLIFGAKLIKLLMEKFPKVTYAFILGLVVGSILHLYPRICQPLGMRIASVLCLVAGYAIINLFEKKKKVDEA